MVAVNQKKVNISYNIAIVFMLLFVFCDLLFDFAFSFNQSDTISFGFTLLSALIVFICTGKINTEEIKEKYYTTTKFIKSNFDNAQVVFSILDIICGLISIFSSYIMLSYIFKIVKFVYIPTKILVVINKDKSLIKPIIKFSYFWVFMRIIEKKGGTMANFLKSNKFTIIYGLLISALFGVTSYFAIPSFLKLATWAVILVSIAVAFIVFALIFFLGKDTVESLGLRLAKKQLPEDKYNELISIYNKAVEEVKAKEAEEVEAKRIDAEVQKRIKAEAKANKTSSVDVEKELFEKKVEARLAELKKQDNQ